MNRQLHMRYLSLIFVQERSLEKRRKAGKYQKKVKAKQRRKTYESANQLEPSELADVWDED
jgi:ribosome biogenesis protein BRX1